MPRDDADALLTDLRSQLEATLGSAVELFHRALAIDSTNASAYVGLAFALAEMADGVKPPIEVYPEAIRDASRAIELDSTNADAWSTRAGLILEYEWDWPRARHEMDRALALNANDALLHVDESFYQTVAWAYLALGDRDRTLTWLEKGVELHSAMGMFNVVWPPFHALKDEPRFRAVLRRLNIPEGVLP